MIGWCLQTVRQVQKIVLRLLQGLAQNAQRNFAFEAGQPESELVDGDLARGCGVVLHDSH